MATIFPTSPAPQVNDEYQGYRYNGTAWEIIGVDLTADYQPRVASVSNTELGYLDGVTSAVQTQLNAKAPLASPTFTGTVTIPAGASVSGYATETYVGTAISNLIDAAPASLDTLNELAAALGDDANYASTITTALGTKAPLASPTFTGSVTVGEAITKTTSTALTSSTVTTIGTFPVASGNCIAVECVVLISSTSNGSYTASKLLITADPDFNAVADITEYAVMKNNDFDLFPIFTATLSGSNVLLRVSATGASNATAKVISTSILAPHGAA